jgi:alkanesulfonate monooxygenase SsuD/methylene tetrahydromethanopterin reductase-like flavin-dependent oxidoreductase (luciferase family)/FAD/FMN-containing dehydrogenase
MPDYGHTLRFGTFIAPVNSPPQKAVDLAMVSDDLGLDLVTFQDHPYQASFHDTWTLLAWVAARTSRVAVSGNVLNLPLRQPAVLARAAASLDLLSGGRFELGLGAGWFWDGIEAMGGQRLTVGEGITALDQAIDVIRGIWDGSGEKPLQAGGEFHAVTGAARGPAPAHEIPIWLGAYQPRMQRLIGRKADGWLPGVPFLQPGDLRRGNEIIDRAATAAGRDPHKITRLLNVTTKESPEDLSRLALDDGVSVFILLGADDPGSIRTFAERVIPETRERVAEARAAHSPTRKADKAPGRPPARTAASLAQRMPHIDYDGVPPALAERAVEPSDRDYPRYTASFLRSGSPGLVLRPQNAAQVQDAVRFAGRHRDVPLGILSAGHGVSGRSLNQGGLVIDVGTLNHIEPLGAGRVRVGPGARWIDVARTLTPLGLAITSGDYGGVGVGGLATAGGIGWFAREHGLTIDHLKAVELVTADGTLVRASADQNPGLFWAMRGAGANFGVAVDFEFEATPVGTVAFAQLVFDATDTATFLTRWGAAIEASHRSVTGEVLLGAAHPSRPSYAQAMIVVDSDDQDTVIERLQPIAAVAPVVRQTVAFAGYDDVMAAFVEEGATQQGFGEPLAHSGLAQHLSPGFSAEAAAMLHAGASHFFTIRSLGGAAGDVPADATAFGWRDANFSVVAFGSQRAGFDRHWQRLQPHFEGLYLSFETATGPEYLARAFPPAHLRRLHELKREWDPTGIFRDNFFIDPAGDPVPGS